MDANLKQKWVEALRSGEYEQNHGGIGDHNKLCCIGVGGRVAGVNAGYSHNNYTLTCADALGLKERDVDSLTEMNDAERKSFAEIADFIEENL